jgi:hypothetical protein
MSSVCNMVVEAGIGWILLLSTWEIIFLFLHSIEINLLYFTVYLNDIFYYSDCVECDPQ